MRRTIGITIFGIIAVCIVVNIVKSIYNFAKEFVVLDDVSTKTIYIIALFTIIVVFALLDLFARIGRSIKFDEDGKDSTDEKQ